MENLNSSFATRLLVVMGMASLIIVAFAWKDEAHAKPATGVQSPTATLTGIVVDQNNALLSDVNITVENADTALKKQAITNREGYFSITLLPPGLYTVLARHQGFATWEVRGVTLNVGDQPAIKIRLRVGSISQSIIVEGASLIQTESAAVSTVVDRQFLENLPLNGRSFETLIELAPGVVLTVANDLGQFSVNGQRSNANYFTIDGVGANIGITVDNFSLAQSAGGTVPAYSPLGGTNTLVSIDALQEFRIQTSTYAAEFGRSPGAQVSVVTRSGNNQFHGTVFDYFRNDALDANDWFANKQGLKKPPLRQNDFGGVVGGPILKSKTFFFLSYEGLRLRQPQVAITTVPSLGARQMALPQTKPLLDAFPLPTGSEIGNGLAEDSASYSNPTDLNATSVRVDHMLNSKMTLFGRYNYAPSETELRNLHGMLSNVGLFSYNTHTATLALTHAISSTISNDFRANYSRNRAAAVAVVDTFGGALIPPEPVLFPPFATPQDTFTFVAVSPIGFVVGGNEGNVQRQTNLVDSLLMTAGTHQMKLGADYRRLSPSIGRENNQISIFFRSVAGAIADTPTSVGIISLIPRQLVFTNFSAYAQDTWKTTPRLTLTYGLRWEVNPPPSETNGNEAFGIIGINDPATMTLAPKGTPLWKTTYDNFAPRLGIAYQLPGDRARGVVLRAGFGLFYDMGTGPTGAAFDGNQWPYINGKTLPNTFPIDPQTTPPDFSLSPPYGGLVAFEPNYKLPRTYQWSLAAEQSLGSHQTITAAYIAELGRRLLRVEVLQGPSLANPNFTRVRVVRNAATSDYHALQLQFQRRLSHGLQALASYTWSHSIDIASFESTRTVSTLKLDPRTDQGASDFDVRHSFSGAATYEIPKPTVNRLADTLLGNWSVDSILRARTATPVDLVASTPPLFGVQNITRPDLVAGVPLYVKNSSVAGGRRINKAAFSTPPAGRQGTLGRNSLRGFPLSQLDLALRRRFEIREGFDLQFRTDFFNILNHPNFGNPLSFLGSPLFGQSLQMLGQSLGGNGGFSPLYQVGGPRSIQLALKLGF